MSLWKDLLMPTVSELKGRYFHGEMVKEPDDKMADFDGVKKKRAYKTYKSSDRDYAPTSSLYIPPTVKKKLTLKDKMDLL